MADSERICVVGLGNPGAKYRGTRHNLGFDWIDEFAASQKLVFKEKFQSLWGQTRYEGTEVHLLKPQTFMNESGRALREWRDKYQGNARILVVFDDLDLPLGRIRFRADGSDGGHRGLRSILEYVSEEPIHRLRLGIGRTNEEAIDAVLGKFTPAERAIVDKVVSDAPWHLWIWIKEKLEMAMNKLNGKSYGT